MPEGFDVAQGEGSASPVPQEQIPANTGEGIDPTDISFIRSQPQFIQMRQLIQQDPNLLQTFLEQIRSSNPQLLQVFF